MRLFPRLTQVTLSAVLALTCLVPVHGAGEDADSSQPDATAGVELSVLAGDKLLYQITGLPIFKVFNGEGRQILELTGLPSDFRQDLDRLLESPPDVGTDARPLTAELALLVTDDDDPVKPSSLPFADFTFVKYWAEWCIPCRAQTEIVHEVIAADPDRRINLVNVEADVTK